MGIQQARAAAREILNREGRTPNLDRLEINIAAAMLEIQRHTLEADESGQDIEGANIRADADDLHRMTLIAESPIYAELFEQYGKKGSQ